MSKFKLPLHYLYPTLQPLNSESPLVCGKFTQFVEAEIGSTLRLEQVASDEMADHSHLLVLHFSAQTDGASNVFLR